ncbi:hypothetical protein ABH973_006241 [Bradyrhizobium ottawaense]|uniref:hypothetical protein n=1 Tax=Bradyrhizobium ottawaense TaxID=931866 RepID=UPI0035157FD3
MTSMFDGWCKLSNRQPVPAPPVLVAQFVAEIAPLGIEAAWNAVQDISRAHYLIGLADPTLSRPVTLALSNIARIDPPRSWKKEHKANFEALPYYLQRYVAEREDDRERTIRRAMNDAAVAKQELETVKNGAPKAAA